VKKKTQPKSIHLAFYFFLLVIFIIIVSLVFKVSDIVRHSKFDGKHTFSVAVLENDKTNVIFVSPQDSSITSLTISPKVGKETLNSLGIPSDGYIKSSSDISGNPKSAFLKTIFRRNSTQTDLTILDLFRLSVFSQGVGNDKSNNQSVNIKDPDFSVAVEKLFIDPTVFSEKKSIVITNATDTPGLGNKIAKYIGDMGANVVLVNSSPSSAKDSVIYFKEKSYTAERLSKSLGIKKEMKEGNAISDITIIIGEDKVDF
jgi:hypothetical protein